MSDPATDLTPLIRDLARRAIDAASDATPHRAHVGEERYRLIDLLPLARALLGDQAPATAAPPVDRPQTAFTDGRGHSRPAYRQLAACLCWRGGLNPAALAHETDPDVSSSLWRAWDERRRGGDAGAAIASVLDACPDKLHAQQPDDPPDHWTYRELVGLHALSALIDHAGDAAPAAWHRRLLEITRYHQDHTQPDYTTYQPWALAAFLRNPETRWFAQQQLHDVETHLAVEGGPGAVLPALLLADAYASLTGQA